MAFPLDLFLSNEIPFPPPPWIGDRPVDFNIGYISPCPEHFAVYAELKRTLQHAFTTLHGQPAPAGAAGHIAALPRGLWQQYHTLCISRPQADALAGPAWRAWTTAVWQLHIAAAEWTAQLHALAEQLTRAIWSPLTEPALRAVFAHLNAFRLHMLTFAGEKMHVDQLCAVALTRRVAREFAHARRALVAAKIYVDCTLGPDALTRCLKCAWSATEYPLSRGFVRRCEDVQRLFVYDDCVGRTSLGEHWRSCGLIEESADGAGGADGDYGRLRAFYCMLKCHVDQVAAWKNVLVCADDGGEMEYGSESDGDTLDGGYETESSGSESEGSCGGG